MTEIRPYTPALLAGIERGLERREEIELAPGLSGEALTFGKAENGSTIVLTRIPSSVAFIPALVCRDRAISGSRRPAELPAEQWERIELESAGFNDRYVLMGLAGQDPGFVRELFSPSLVAWLESEPPDGFSFELNEGFLTVALPGHLRGAERARLLGLAGEVTSRLAAEIGEEGEASLDVFSEEKEIRDLERAITEVGYDDPPESVQAAIASAKRRAGLRPRSLLTALGWGVIAGGVAGAIGYVTSGPTLAVALALGVGVPALLLGWLVGRAAYRWGTVGVERVGLQAWTEGYARSRGLQLEDRWRFHALHKDLPMPGFADHVLAGPIPGASGVAGRLLFMSDSPELRAQGQEIAYTASRPFASSALLVEAERELAADASVAELPEEYSLEVHGRQILLWRPVQGNLLRTSAGTDRFCERAGAVLRRVLSA